ncbi:unnamed protein product [Caenorhabditis angaria]|uniref:Uncharacterized protein n=1 Tax=Caenorhabditis angaria TaxID=860376 RepID=A0A9P1IIJ4_9PELO|nr:unnamed protein product [Caenorhabditis angaria]
MILDFKSQCEEEFSNVTLILTMIGLIPIIFGILTTIFIGMTIWKVRQMMSACDGITSSAHWLSRTSVRVGIGASAKQTLFDYAKSKPELARFINLK